MTMFDKDGSPRIYGIAPGVDFPRILVAGLIARMRGQPPEAMARVHLLVNTRRMARRVRELFDHHGAMLLPRMSLITELDDLAGPEGFAPAVSGLRRRLELAQLIAGLIRAQPDIAAQSSVFDLADSLAALIDEAQGEGVDASTISSLDVSDLSGHWARAQAFFAIAESYISSSDSAAGAEARQRGIVERLTGRWVDTPPDHPVIVAGSTGSRGTTQMLMQAVARLPQGAVILPGFDFDQPSAVWEQMGEALSSEDHPQFRFRRLMRALEIDPGDIDHWTEGEAPVPARSQLVSLALRPAPFTDAWLSEGPNLPDLRAATRDLSLIEASSPRAEALAIALLLRQAVEDGKTAALVTPDRMLTRQVAAALDRWDILPDDSAGTPLHLSPPGRFLRHVADLFARRLTSDALLALLKHPLCHDNDQRGTHLRRTRDLELHIRRHGPPFPDRQSLVDYSNRKDTPRDWVEWVADGVADQTVTDPLTLGDWVARLRGLAERLSAGQGHSGSGTLWEMNAGQEARAAIDELEAEADAGGAMTAREFVDLLGNILSRRVVRDRDAPDGRVMIWGTLEARVQGADMLILGGLNEGIWPEAAAADPWWNRTLRDRAGLLLPERRIGLAAHDFQQAVNAPEVWLTRARRSDDAETVVSRWLNRLTNLLNGLPDQGGPEALAGMRARGAHWLTLSDRLEAAERQTPAIRPSPRPPVAARPRRLSVTEIKTLIRDPYAIYARHVLRLRPLDPLFRAPDALLRGIVVHKVLETFVRDTATGTVALTPEALMDTARRILGAEVPWPIAQRLWLARLEHVAGWFIAHEVDRQDNATPIAFEAKLSADLKPLGFTLTGKADRIDRDADGALLIYDYKTGAPPSEAQQKRFDKQLLLEAAAAEQGGFATLGPSPVAGAVFIGLARSPKEVPAPLDDEPPARIWAEFGELIAGYLSPTQGFTARRALFKEGETGDYDQLARFGEWDRTTAPVPENLA